MALTYYSNRIDRRPDIMFYADVTYRTQINEGIHHVYIAKCKEHNTFNTLIYEWHMELWMQRMLRNLTEETPSPWVR